MLDARTVSYTYPPTPQAALTHILFPVDPMHYEGGANMRAPVEKNVYDTGAPSAADILYHNEMAYLQDSVKWVGFGAIEATGVIDRGGTFLCSGQHLTDELKNTALYEKLREKGLEYVRKLPDRKYFQGSSLFLFR